MTTQTASRRPIPGRIAALVAIAVVAAALGLIRFTGDGDAVRVPPGARAGRLTLELPSSQR